MPDESIHVQEHFRLQWVHLIIVFSPHRFIMPGALTSYGTKESRELVDSSESLK